MHPLNLHLVDLGEAQEEQEQMSASMIVCRTMMTVDLDDEKLDSNPERLSLEVHSSPILNNHRLRINRNTF